MTEKEPRPQSFRQPTNDTTMVDLEPLSETPEPGRIAFDPGRYSVLEVSPEERKKMSGTKLQPLDRKFFQDTVPPERSDQRVAPTMPVEITKPLAPVTTTPRAPQTPRLPSAAPASAAADDWRFRATRISVPVPRPVVEQPAELQTQTFVTPLHVTHGPPPAAASPVKYDPFKTEVVDVEAVRDSVAKHQAAEKLAAEKLLAERLEATKLEVAKAQAEKLQAQKLEAVRVEADQAAKAQRVERKRLRVALWILGAAVFFLALTVLRALFSAEKPARTSTVSAEPAPLPELTVPEPVEAVVAQQPKARAAPMGSNDVPEGPIEHASPKAVTAPAAAVPAPSPRTKSASPARPPVERSPASKPPQAETPAQASAPTLPDDHAVATPLPASPPQPRTAPVQSTWFDYK